MTLTYQTPRHEQAAKLSAKMKKVIASLAQMEKKDASLKKSLRQLTVVRRKATAEFGECVRTLRGGHIKQGAFARMSGIDPTRLSMYENGCKHISPIPVADARKLYNLLKP